MFHRPILNPLNFLALFESVDLYSYYYRDLKHWKGGQMKMDFEMEL